MKLVIQIFILLICFNSFCQEDFKDTTWFDLDWKVSGKTNAQFYRVYKKTKNGFLVHDKYLNNQSQMVVEATAINPKLMKNGHGIYFYSNGIKVEQGNYSDNNKIGDWVKYFNGGKDSSITRYKSDGSSEVIRRSSEQEIYTIVEVQAEFPGGISEMIKFIQNNLKYPENARKLLLGGKAFLKFVVNEDGNINNTEIIKGTGNKEMDEEAIRVLKLMPKWKPASMKGENVKCYFNLPLSFSLTEPFYTYNIFNKNEQYLKIASLIFEGKASEAYFLVKDVDDTKADIDLLYDKAILYFTYTDRKKSCEIFEKINQLADKGSSIYKNSDKYYNQYCN
ncbi:energy transducer TonB [Sediminibacterium sp.]|uniref:energy transducer TonB n=1 Tax=Sediminibacterium sp. TaxID=1917865 RepID=UPI002725B71E|nr:energy transducer TonB [Sediminibacterium sp.]MDO9000600.1 energy transducer TonB [Bacteroidota bacterium]MDP3146832.1 energy transducer TonB [Bacteroidota bacterium]MDP3567622.1 energy transducer TonB [Sediminibacterium sp.]